MQTENLFSESDLPGAWKQDAKGVWKQNPGPACSGCGGDGRWHYRLDKNEPPQVGDCPACNGTGLQMYGPGL